MAIPLKIRAHHLLCLQGFQGYGYNNAFVDHLQGIVAKLKTDPELLVEVVTACDAICAGCPHCQEAECRKDDGAAHRVETLDLAILKSTGIKPNHIAKAAHLLAQINTTFQTRSQRAKICGDCQWIPICTWYLGSRPHYLPPAQQSK